LNNLIIDFGNSYKKIAIENNGEIIFINQYFDFSVIELQELESKYSFNNIIMSTVLFLDKNLENYLHSKYNFIKISHKTPIPIINNYQTPQTLGGDRLACAVAAHTLYPESNCLIIQMGSCITFDFVNNKGEYQGGSISPGLNMRFKALHTYTKKLPYLCYHSTGGLIGNSTNESIQLGVANGIILECNGMINQYKNIYPNLKVLLTGGDFFMFENKSQHEIISIPNLVLVGLSIILKYNDAKKN